VVDPDFALRFISIVLVNISLSGDNVIVIGAAAASLPRSQRRLAIFGGGLLAIVLRIVMTSIAARLMLVPLISLVGGLVLIVVAWGLTQVDGKPRDGIRPSAHGLRMAVQLIVIADVTMSLDNVIAVGGTARGDDALLVAGIVVSVPLLMAAAGVVSIVVDRFRWLVYLGAAAICLTASRMILEDGAVAAVLPFGPAQVLGISLPIAIAVPLAGRWRRLRRVRPNTLARGNIR
jgi:YjbE family integral membrane protein